MNSFKLWIIHVGRCSQDSTSSGILRPKEGCWDPQMKSFIVDFKMDSELNSVSQNSPFYTPRCRIQVWATIGQGDRPPAPLSLNTHYFFNFGSSRAPLHLPPRGCLPSRSLLLGPTSCGELQAALAAGPKDCSSTAATQGPTNLRIWGTPCRLAPSCYPYKRKEWPVSSRDVTVTGVMVNHGKFPDGEGYR